MYPLDFARVRVAADVLGGKQGGEREFKGSIDCFRKIYKSDGPIGFYRGYGISVASIIAYRALYFGLFDTGKALLFKDH